jgi:hypothetical protein
LTDLSNLYLPSIKQIRYLVEDIRRAATFKDPATGMTGLDMLEASLVEARRRAANPDLERDAYPSSSMGSGGGRGVRSIIATDENGNDDAVPLQSTTEALAIPQADGDVKVPHDVVAHDAEVGCDMLRQARDSLLAAQTRMVHLTKVSTPLTRSENGGAGTCQGCAEGVSGSANDRLKRGLCPRCYTAWRRAGTPLISELRRLLGTWERFDQREAKEPERVDPKERAS